MENNSKEKNFISAVVYLHNNEEGIVSFVKDLHETLRANFTNYEIIIVNDCSTDGSVDAVKQYAEAYDTPVISILNMSFCQGVELCMSAGLDLAIGDFVYEFDSIGRDWDWALLFDVYTKSLEGYDIVCALNKRRKNSVSQHLFYWLFNKYAHIQHTIHNHSFSLITRRGINRVRSLTKTVPFRKALYANCGLDLYNLEFVSTGSELKNARGTCPGQSYSSLILFTDLAYKFAFTMTIMMTAIILLVVIYAVVIFFTGKPVEGWTTTMLLVGLSFLALFMIMAVILKYLSLLMNLIFRKHNYVFKSIEKLINQ